MKERGILFMPEMVKAILEGRKTMTRRLQGLKELNEHPEAWKFIRVDKNGGDLIIDEDGEKEKFFDKAIAIFDFCGNEDQWFGEDSICLLCHYGRVGDILYVKETYCSGFDDRQEYYYKADEKNIEEFKRMGWKWKSSLFMPKAAARIWLEITDIKVERIQDITEEDVYSEGVKIVVEKTDNPEWVRPLVRAGSGEFLPINKNNLTSKHYAIAEFALLWNEINSKTATWTQNPYVWCVSFKRIEKPVS